MNEINVLYIVVTFALMYGASCCFSLVYFLFLRWECRDYAISLVCAIYVCTYTHGYGSVSRWDVGGRDSWSPINMGDEIFRSIERYENKKVKRQPHFPIYI